MIVAIPAQMFAVRLLGSMAFERFEQSERFDRPSQPRMLPVTRKGQALLAFLLAQPGVWWSRERLGEIFWPVLPAEAARNNLRQVLLHLQRALGDKVAAVPVLAAHRQAIRFDPASGYPVDLAAFVGQPPGCPAETVLSGSADCSACIERMENLAALYRGEFLSGFHLDECPEFDDWVRVQRETLLRRALALLERLVDCCERQGAYGRAFGFAQRLIELEPWSESGQRRAMTAAAHDGQHGAALGLYNAFCRNLETELGVQPEDETRTLARAIQAGSIAPPAVPIIPFISAYASERRQVTVLHCQFDTPAEATDPEATLALLRGPIERSTARIQAFSGHVARTNHGALLAYFGYPQAQENAALQGARAALAVIDEVSPLVSVRVGMHTGLILTGGDPRLPDVVGQITGVAIRLSAQAGVGEVWLGTATHRLVAGFVRSKPVDGIAQGAEGAAAFRLLAVDGAAHRLEHPRNLMPLRGRAVECARLEVAWDNARRGERSVFLLRGYPGIGKSRLLQELCRTSLAQARTLLDLQCTSESHQSPFQPVINLCARWFGFQSGETPEQHFARLVVALQRWGHAAPAAVPLLAALLGLPVAAPYRPVDCTPQQRRERTMSCLLDRLESLAAARPLLLVVEDVHWIDPSSLELLTRLIRRKMPAAVLTVMTARPEFTPPWPAKSVPCLTLGPLDDADIRAVVEAAGPGIAEAALPDIVRRADGVPLFAEELAKAAASDGDSAIPASLHDLLAARLDAQGHAKQLALLAATIGGVVPYAMLEALCPNERTAIDAALDRLQNTGLMTGSRESGYEFRHALFRDSAYASQTLADRRATHRRVAEFLEAGLPEIAAARPEVMAHHWAEGGAPEKAIRWWIRAARSAHLNDAHQESLSHACAGLDLLSASTAPELQAECELSLQVSRGMAAYAVEGYASPQGWAAYARAVALGEAVGADGEAFTALWGLWASTSSHSDWGRALDLAQRLLRLAQRARDPVQKQQAHFAVGNIQFWRGEFVQARSHLRQAMALYRPEHHEALISGYGESAYVTSAAYLSWVLCMMGQSEQAREIGRHAVDTARRIDHPFSLGYALTFHTVLHRMLRLPQETRTLAEETIALADAHGFPLWTVGATLNRGWARVMLGDDDGLADMSASVDTVRSLMNGILVIFLETQADGLRHAGRTEAALAVIAEAQERGAALDDHHVEAELLRLKGVCLLDQEPGNHGRAEAYFQQALAVAQRQRARLPELRAAMALAELHAPSRQRRLLPVSLRE